MQAFLFVAYFTNFAPLFCRKMRKYLRINGNLRLKSIPLQPNLSEVFLVKFNFICQQFNN